MWISKLLFLYTNSLSLEFHKQSINEMLRVSREVRIFPLLDVNALRLEYVDIIIDFHAKMHFCVEEIKVDYEFQKGGNSMLKITHRK